MNIQNVINSRTTLDKRSSVNRLKKAISNNTHNSSRKYPYVLDIYRSTHFALPGSFSNGTVLRGSGTPFTSTIAMDVHGFSGISAGATGLSVFTDLTNGIWPSYPGISYPWILINPSSNFGGITAPTYLQPDVGAATFTFKTNASCFGIMAGPYGNSPNEYDVYVNLNDGSGLKSVTPYYPLPSTRPTISMDASISPIIYFNFPNNDPRRSYEKTILISGIKFFSGVCVPAGSTFQAVVPKTVVPVVCLQGDSMTNGIDFASLRMGCPIRTNRVSSWGGSGWTVYSRETVSTTGQLAGLFKIIGISQVSSSVTVTAIGHGEAGLDPVNFFRVGDKVIFSQTGTALDGNQLTITAVGGSNAGGWQCTVTFAPAIGTYSGSSGSPLGYADTTDPDMVYITALNGNRAYVPSGISKSITRLNMTVEPNPDMVIIALGRNDPTQAQANQYNDNNSTWNDDLEAAILYCLTYIRANLPNAFIVCVSEWTASSQGGAYGTSDTAAMANYSNLNNQITAISGPWCIINTSSNTYKYRTLSGAIVAGATNWQNVPWVRGTAIADQPDNAAVNTIENSYIGTYNPSVTPNISNAKGVSVDGTHYTQSGYIFRILNNISVTDGTVPGNAITLYAKNQNYVLSNLTQSAGSITGTSPNSISVGSIISVNGTGTSIDGQLFTISSVGGSAGAYTFSFSGSFTGAYNVLGWNIQPTVSTYTQSVLRLPLNTEGRLSVVPISATYGMDTSSEYIITYASRNTSTNQVTGCLVKDYLGNSLTSGTIPANSYVYSKDHIINYDGQSTSNSYNFGGFDYVGGRVAEIVSNVINLL